MGTTHATANGPFEFTDGTDKQMSIPLYPLQFTNATLSLDATDWTLVSSHSSDKQVLRTIQQQR